MPSSSFAIVGAGVMGRQLALELLKRNHTVTIYEKSSLSSEDSCSFIAGGMVAPWSELFDSHPLVFEIGKRSLLLWKEMTKEYQFKDTLFESGTLFLAKNKDKQMIDHIQSLIQKNDTSCQILILKSSLLSNNSCYLPNTHQLLNLQNKEHLENQIEQIAREFQNGFYLPDEITINARAFLKESTRVLQASKARLMFHTEVFSLKEHEIYSSAGSEYFDHVVDCTGYFAKDRLEDIRGVRGEIIRVRARDVNLDRTIRILHHRYPVYIIPLLDHEFLIGASLIESESPDGVCVQSILELLSVAASIHKGFLQAHVIETNVHYRPAFFDNMPRIIKKDGVYFLNGLYRHGYLMSPLMAKIFADQFEQKNIKEAVFQELFLDEGYHA